MRCACLVLCATFALSLAIAPQPAEAINPVKPLCKAASWINGLAGKVCGAVQNSGRILNAGKKLLSGHPGAAGQALSGVSKVGAAVGLTAIVAWVLDGAKAALTETSKLIGSTTRPQLQTTWFSSTYWRMAGIATLLTLPFLFAAAVQAVLRGDLALLLRAAVGYLPLALLAVSVAAPVATLLLSASDEMSAMVSAAAGGNGTAVLAKVGALFGGAATLDGSPFLAFLVGLFVAAGAFVLWLELLIREAAVYVVVLMLPLAFAALVWPARRIWAVRTVELLVALILAKFAIVAVLSLAAAALGHGLVPGAQAMLAGLALVSLATVAPWALLRLLPMSEIAATAAGSLRREVSTSPLAKAASEAGAAAAGRSAEPSVDLEGATDPAQEAARSQTEGFATTPRGEVTEAEPPVEAELPGEEEPPVEAEPPGEEEPAGQADDDSKPPPRKERIPGYPPLYQRANETWRPIKLGIEAWPPKSLDPEEDEDQPLDPGPLVDFGSDSDGRL